MSITSVGGSFGYIDPASLAGPVASSQPQADAPDTPSVPEPAKAPSDTPPQTATTATASDAPKFAPATGAALIQIQEKASAAAA